MDEIIVRLARALASTPRLCILSLLGTGEKTPTHLAETLGLPLCAVSLHLRVLILVGLISRRKSGPWCYYRAESPYDSTTVSGRLAAWLRTLLKNQPVTLSQYPGLLKVRDIATTPAAELFRTIFEASTAFTDLRRLQVLRHLGRHHTAGTQDLVELLSMSPQALNRHMHKLIRRGFVLARHHGHTVVYELNPAAKTPIHRRMFEIVRVTWEQAISRTL